METRSLWPEFEVEETKSPKTILKEQAGYLAEKTNNVISAIVETMQFQSNLKHEFFIVAPALNNYRYKILTATHGVFFYPVDIVSSTKELYEAQEAQDQGQLMRILKEVFNSPEVVKIISSLLSQSLAE